MYFCISVMCAGFDILLILFFFVVIITNYIDSITKILEWHFTSQTGDVPQILMADKSIFTTDAVFLISNACLYHVISGHAFPHTTWL